MYCEKHKNSQFFVGVFAHSILYFIILAGIILGYSAKLLLVCIDVH